MVGKSHQFTRVGAIGWHNFLKYTKSSNDPIYYDPFLLNIAILRGWSSGAPEIHNFVLAICVSKSFIKPITNLSNSHFITKVRMYETIENGVRYGYIDYFYNNVSENSVSVLVINDHSTNNLIHWEYVNGMPIVANIPDNAENTPILEHTFKSNSWLDGPDTWPLS